MKKAFPVTMLLFAMILLTGTSWKAESPKGKTDAKKEAIPAGIQKILVDHSCTTCHGVNGKAMALSHLKLGEWDNYSSEKQAQKAEAICKVATKGKMPPKGFLAEHPDARLTQAQVDSLCAWSATLNPGK
jgi:cytochrome c5